MPEYIVQSLFQLLIAEKFNLHNLRITVLGITFKEDIADIRNSKALEIVTKLKRFGLDVQVYDPYVSSDQLKGENIELKQWEELKKADVIVLTTPHQILMEKNKKDWQSLCKDGKGIVMDVKNVIPEKTFANNIKMWRL